MFSLLLIVLRYLFLVLLYVFLFYVLIKMFQYLKHQERELAVNGTKPRYPVDLSPDKANAPEAQLVALNEGELPRIYPVKGTLSLGRDVDNHVVVLDTKVSRHHARIYSSGGQYWIEDLNSKNGVFLNDIKLRGPVVLADGDKFRIGNVIFVFVRWGHEVEQGDTRRAGSQC